MQNPTLSRVIVGGTVLYIRETFLVSAVLIGLAPKISIFGAGRRYVADTYDYWYQLY
jgi:hypothetical protein